VVDLATIIADAWDWSPVGESQLKTKRALENAAAKEIADYSLSPATERKQAIKLLVDKRPKNAYRAKTNQDKIETIKRPSFEIGNLYGVFFDGVRKTAPILRRRLMMKFHSTGHRYKRFQRKGEIDERSLWRLAIGDDRFYKRKTLTQTNRSIVTILVDCSASMTRAARKPGHEGEPLVFRTRLFVAAQAAAAVSSALDALKVPNEVLAFTTSRKNPAPDPWFDRVRALRHLIIKPFNRSFRSCRANFLSLAFFEHCSENIDGEALLWAAKRMLSKPDHGDRPALIVFSDGEPASHPENVAALAHHLKTTVDKIEASGIAVFGIGVGSEAVREFYRNSVVVCEVSNLLSSFYDLLEKVLQERRRIQV
jgi:cobaltochelatase CobT